MSVGSSSLLSAAMQSGELKYYSDESAINYLIKKLNDNMTEVKSF